MKVSIITVCYNSELTISDTIKSVVSQNYPETEYVIIDGKSSDRTINIIKSFGDKITTFISEPDFGIYDAMNKGIAIASGEIIGILNSDDVFFSQDTIQNVVNIFIRDSPDAVYGNIVMCSAKDWDLRFTRTWIAGDQNSFIHGWHPPHPAFFVKKHVYQSYGNFRTDFKISADFELMLRFFERHKIKVSYLNSFLVKMRLGGASTGSLKNIILGNKNISKAFKENGIKYLWYYPILRGIRKVSQYIK